METRPGRPLVKRIEKDLRRRSILALRWVSLFMDMSSEMIYPLLPVFLASILGVSSLTIGFVAGLSELVASLCRVTSGAVSDRVRRRKIVVTIGYSLSTISRPLLAVASSWVHVLSFRVIDRAGKGVRTPPRDALIADAATPATYGRYYGYHRAMDTAGAVIGPALAAAAMGLGTGMRTVFWISAIPACTAVLIIQLFIRETGWRVNRRRPYDQGQHLSRSMRIFLLVTAVFSLGNSSNFFLILRAHSLGFRSGEIPLLYMVMNVTYALFSYPSGRLADRFGKANITFCGYFLYAVIYTSFAAVVTKPVLWLLFPLYGLYLGFTDGVGRAYLATLLPSTKRATGFALYHMVIGLTLLPASVLGGWLWDNVSPVVTFAAGAFLSLIAGILFGFLLLGQKSATHHETADKTGM